LLFGVHRTATHSVMAVLVVVVVAVVVARKAEAPVVRVAALCGAAWASHLVLDWMAVDDFPPRGIQALWPFSRAWFISGWDLFAGTERHHLMTVASLRANARAAAGEVALVGPLAFWAWRARRRC
jgi:membrane-bound metal-dependent hydrolase YbcI (DUF457 family)